MINSIEFEQGLMEDVIAFERVEKLIKVFEQKNSRPPDKLFVSDSEELQSYLLWAGITFGLKTERTSKFRTWVE